MVGESNAQKKPGVLGSINAASERVLESNKKSNLLIITLVLLVAIPLFGVAILTTRFIAPQQVVSFAGNQEAVAAAGVGQFLCVGQKFLTAVFTTTQVQLTLSDGRQLTLPLSASGTRYENPDGTFVFWDKGITASIVENGATTYSDCVSNS